MLRSDTHDGFTLTFNKVGQFRVPMAQAQKRADRELQAQPLAMTPGTTSYSQTTREFLLNSTISIFCSRLL